jgi:hypothetical protein
VIADVLEHEGRQVADAIGASARFEALDVTREESCAAVVAARAHPSGASRKLQRPFIRARSPLQDASGLNTGIPGIYVANTPRL